MCLKTDAAKTVNLCFKIWCGVCLCSPYPTLHRELAEVQSIGYFFVEPSQFFSITPCCSPHYVYCFRFRVFDGNYNIALQGCSTCWVTLLRGVIFDGWRNCKCLLIKRLQILIELINLKSRTFWNGNFFFRVVIIFTHRSAIHSPRIINARKNFK